MSKDLHHSNEIQLTVLDRKNLFFKRSFDPSMMKIVRTLANMWRTEAATYLRFYKDHMFADFSCTLTLCLSCIVFQPLILFLCLLQLFLKLFALYH